MEQQKLVVLLKMEKIIFHLLPCLTLLPIFRLSSIFFLVVVGRVSYSHDGI